MILHSNSFSFMKGFIINLKISFTFLLEIVLNRNVCMYASMAYISGSAIFQVTVVNEKLLPFQFFIYRNFFVIFPRRIKHNKKVKYFSSAGNNRGCYARNHC